MQEMFNDNMYDETWQVVLSNRGQYTLNKAQADILKEAITRKEKMVMFKSFVIPIAHIVEFYLKDKRLKDEYVLPSESEDNTHISEVERKKIRKELDKMRNKLSRLLTISR